VCYRDFHHWEKSYQHMCSDMIIFHMCWYWVLVNQRFPRFFFFWIWVKCLYNKQNNTWTLGDMNLSSSVQAQYLTSERSKLMRYWAWTLEDKFHISALPCIIFYIISTPTTSFSLASISSDVSFLLYVVFLSNMSQ
jgi:hypothetical protein